jgi:hypothetical protein
MPYDLQFSLEAENRIAAMEITGDFTGFARNLLLVVHCGQEIRGLGHRASCPFLPLIPR